MATYTTKSGDKWDSIAYTQLGSDDYAYELMRANGKHLDTYIFEAGVVLTLPEIAEEAETSATLPPWKR